MTEKIKTRPVHKDVKVLDKTAAAAERMKGAYIRTRNQAEQTQVQEQTSPVEYAEGQVLEKAERAARGTIHQAGKQGKKAFRTVRERFQAGKQAEDFRENPGESSASFSSAGEENLYQPKEHIKNRTEGQTGGAETAKRAIKDRLKEQNTAGRTGAAPSRKNAAQIQKSPIKTIKTWERQERTVKTIPVSVKEAGKPAIKGTGRTIKTAGQTGHSLIKTTEGTVKITQQGARAAVLTTQRAAVAARQAAAAGVQGVKTAARATTAAVKAILAATKGLITAILAGGWIVVLLLLIVILFGALFSMVGGSNSSTVEPVSAEVQAYEPLIRQYARQHGIEEYVELIKAVMMQESGGRGNDPMQASECGYNTRYPNTPNGITDPEYSIDVGIQNLAACLREAEVENPVDMNRIKLALQGYNYGNGYISWAQENYGGYTYANAVEFSEIMAERNGWSSYGDKEYVSHVLRYYVFGRIPAGTGSQAIVQVALTQLGNEGGEPYWSWYPFENHVEWCACFVSWCADQCGYLESGTIPKFSLCSDGADWFKRNGQWQDRNYEPQSGDLIFYDWENDGITDHVGIVEKVENGMVYTVEGNTSDADHRNGDVVAQHSYPIGSRSIYGYGVPIY